MTLVELLVVMSIIVVLAAAAAPMLKRSLKGQKVREAARQINGFLAGAKARAAERGRPVGVWIERNSRSPLNGTSHSVELFLANVAPPYVGDTLESRAIISREQIPAGTGPYVNIARFTDSNMLASLVFPGDLIRFNFQGRLYEIVDVGFDTLNTDQGPVPVSYCIFALRDPTGPTPALTPTPASPPPLTWYTAYGASFQILRRPTRSIAAPLVLPREICIDLTVSGMGVRSNQFMPANPVSGSDPFVAPNPANDDSPVIITFYPSGEVEQVYWGEYQTGASGPALQLLGHAPWATIYLLVGHIDQVHPEDPFYHAHEDREHLDANVRDPRSLWISIGHRTGTVASTENADTHEFDPEIGFTSWPAPPGVPTIQQKRSRLAAARWFARSQQSMGGR